MKMNILANASINQLTLIDLRIEPCEVHASHEYVMNPAPIERFIYIIKGEACFFIESTELLASERSMIYLPKETAYHSKWFKNSEFMVIDLLLHDSEGQTICFNEEPTVLFCDTHGVYLGLLKELAEKSDSVGPFDWLERMSLSFKLLCEIARDTNRTEIEGQKQKIKVGLNYLEHNYCLDFTVDFLAKLSCMSSGSFRRIFLECMGMSPVEYRNKLRIQKAAVLLKSGKYTISEVAETVGIKDITYFSRLFKRYIGVTPSVIKNK